MRSLTKFSAIVAVALLSIFRMQGDARPGSMSMTQH